MLNGKENRGEEGREARLEVGGVEGRCFAFFTKTWNSASFPPSSGGLLLMQMSFH